MGGKNNAPPPPDYSKLIDAQVKSSDQSFALGKDQLAWAKQQYADNKVINDQIIGTAMDTQAKNNKFADEQQQRYKDVYQPLQDSLIADSKSYGSPERQQMEMGKAQANVAENFENARRAASTQLESFGVDPSSTRYAALDAGSRIQQAAAQAAAGNSARTQTENTGMALRSQALGIGQALPGQAAISYGAGLQAGNQGANVGLATTASGANTMGTAPQWQGIGSGAINSAGNLMNQSYNNQMQQYQSNQQSSSGIGSILGAAAGFLPMLMAEGGSTDPSNSSPTGAIPSEATPGGKIPAHASPSQGKAVDDVDAKLTAGEFVVPKDAVAWLGEKHFQQLIQKSRKDRQEATAKPTYALHPKGTPTFTSRPQSAIPAAA